MELAPLSRQRPSIPLITHLPSELLIKVVDLIDAPRDLLSLALTSHLLKDVVIPCHSEYRVIRCRLNSGIWAHLAACRGLARNVREIEVIFDSDSGRPECAPSTLHDNSTVVGATDDSDGVEQLVTALQFTEHLKVFHWSSDLCINNERNRNAEAAVFKKLHQLKSLKYLSFDVTSKRLDHHTESTLFGPKHPVGCCR